MKSEDISKRLLNPEKYTKKQLVELVERMANDLEIKEQPLFSRSKEDLVTIISILKQENDALSFLLSMRLSDFHSKLSQVENIEYEVEVEPSEKEKISYA